MRCERYIAYVASYREGVTPCLDHVICHMRPLSSMFYLEHSIKFFVPVASSCLPRNVVKHFSLRWCRAPISWLVSHYPAVFAVLPIITRVKHSCTFLQVEPNYQILSAKNPIEWNNLNSKLWWRLNFLKQFGQTISGWIISTPTLTTGGVGDGLLAWLTLPVKFN